jgi:hypothetical protein
VYATIDDFIPASGSDLIAMNQIAVISGWNAERILLEESLRLALKVFLRICAITMLTESVLRLYRILRDMSIDMRIPVIRANWWAKSLNNPLPRKTTVLAPFIERPQHDRKHSKCPDTDARLGTLHS